MNLNKIESQIISYSITGGFGKSESVKGNKVGATTILDARINQLVQAEVFYGENEGLMIYGLFVDGSQVGYLTMLSKYEVTPVCMNYPYISMMENTAKRIYKNVGTRLHQIAIEKSFLLGSKGVLILKAEMGSHIFHYKSGFRTRNAELEKEIQTAISDNTKTISKKYQYEWMFLSDKTAEEKTKTFDNERILSK
jgi:hypothetical protein